MVKISSLANLLNPKDKISLEKFEACGTMRIFIATVNSKLSPTCH